MKCLYIDKSFFSFFRISLETDVIRDNVVVNLKKLHT